MLWFVIADDKPGRRYICEHGFHSKETADGWAIWINEERNPRVVEAKSREEALKKDKTNQGEEK